MNEMIKVGSRYFFESLPGYIQHDSDWVFLVDIPDDFKITKQVRFNQLKRCEFCWKKLNKEDFIRYTLENNPPMQVGKFLIPKFAHSIGLEIKDLELLKPVIENLDYKHKYEEVIFNAYLENNDFILTEEQLYLAYKIYKEARPELYKN